MRTIIAGSRTVNSGYDIRKAVEGSGFQITEVFSGCALGADRFGELWALQNNVAIRCFPADWKKHGKAAGPIRNRQMAEQADALIAIWDGKSKGTKHMIDIARRVGLKVYVHLVPETFSKKDS